MLRGAALLDALLRVPYRERDAWIDAALGIEPPPEDEAELPRGAVPYLPCGVDEIVTLTRALPLGPGDTLVDLGSGLGRVAILAHLLTGAKAHGIEVQAHLVQAARDRCTALGLDAVTFEHANVLEATLTGSIFFLYAPFNGALLRAVLARLEQVARERPLVVCSVDLELDVPWLRVRAHPSLSLTIYDSATRPDCE